MAVHFISRNSDEESSVLTKVIHYVRKARDWAASAIARWLPRFNKKQCQEATAQSIVSQTTPITSEGEKSKSPFMVPAMDPERKGRRRVENLSDLLDDIHETFEAKNVDPFSIRADVG